jgi:hypothetical protein
MEPSSPELDSAARESIIFARLQEWDKAITSGPESLINHIERKPCGITYLSPLKGKNEADSR